MHREQQSILDGLTDVDTFERTTSWLSELAAELERGLSELGSDDPASDDIAAGVLDARALADVWSFDHDVDMACGVVNSGAAALDRFQEGPFNGNPPRIEQASLFQSDTVDMPQSP